MLLYLASLCNISAPHLSLLSFPPRRSSDLLEPVLAELLACDEPAVRGGRLAVAAGNRVTGRVDHRPCMVTESARSEEHTSELQSHVNLVCRLLLEKKK